MTLNPHAPIFYRENSSRLFSIYRPELLIEMDASTFQDNTDPIVPAKCPKASSNSNSPRVSEQLNLLTTRVDQLRLTSKQALEQTKPLIQTFSIANFKQFQYLCAVQQQVAQFFVDLNTEKSEGLNLQTTIRQLEDELAELRPQVSEPSPSSIPVPFTIYPPCSTVVQDNCALNNAQLSKPSITTILIRAPSTISKSRLLEQPKALPSAQSTSGPSSDLGTRVKQLEEEITKTRNCRETIISNYRSQFTFLYARFRALESGDTDTILWKLTSLRLVSDTAKSATRLDDAATNPSTQYNSPVYRTHPHGYNFFVQFYPYGLDSAAGNHASIRFALFPGDYDGLLTWPFPETILLSVRDQLDPQNKWTITFAPSKKISLRRPTLEQCPTLTNFNFFPHSKMFSKTESFLLNNTLYLEIKLTDLPDPEGTTPSTFKP